ncbi:bacteriocin fulvocin C-related protein [Draconibacterium mangrovi]|uniref:bacteriocin fulvocin C-related protein n=1 Tax=Draconibacterium mangrovi TaxID=2697469 RepID=UPI0013D417B2|nr:bacteriocin fulvocin C-related protein [Draconibacterium mangrovi]
MRYWVLLLLIFTIIFTSCNHEELVYSCDTEINAIVKSATKEFSELNLNDFLGYDLVFQRAIFRSFTPEKMRVFWLEKLDSVQIVNSYTEEEQAHIQKLIDHLDLGYFNMTKVDSTEILTRQDFIKNWLDHARVNLNWSTKHIRYILYSLYITEDQYTVSSIEQRENTLQSMSESCDCSSEMDCSAGIGYSCVSGGCSTGLGCGPFWLTDCTGTCQ